MSFWHTTLGYAIPVPTNSSSSLTLNSANTKLALSFIPQTSKTLSKVVVYVHSLTGSPAAADYKCELFSSSISASSAGKPATMLQAGTGLVSAPTGAGWIEFPGFSYNLTAGTLYHIVLSNTNATPGTVNMSYRYAGGNLAPLQYFTPTTFGWMKMHTTDNGSTWVSITSCIPTIRLEMSDASFEGFAYEGSGLYSGNNQIVYGDHELGTEFDLPNNCALRVVGIAMCPSTCIGTPNAARYRMRTGDSRVLQATTHDIPFAQFSSNGWKSAFFTSPVELLPNTHVVVTCTASGGDTSNYHRLGAMKCKDDDDSKTLWPFSPQKVYYDGTTWTTDSTLLYPCLLLLDYGDEFAPNRILTHPGMTGGCRG